MSAHHHPYLKPNSEEYFYYLCLSAMESEPIYWFDEIEE